MINMGRREVVTCAVAKETVRGARAAKARIWRETFIFFFFFLSLQYFARFCDFGYVDASSTKGFRYFTDDGVSLALN
jgi:hypothetical protein